MKLRQGFISNSSSSSFILSGLYSREDIDSIRKYLDIVLNNYKEKQIKHEISLGLQPDSVRSWWQNSYTKENNRINIKVDSISNLRKEIEFWYAPCDLISENKLVIYAEADNYIPYDICKKIIKKFDVDRYNLHMG